MSLDLKIDEAFDNKTICADFMKSFNLFTDEAKRLLPEKILRNLAGRLELELLNTIDEYDSERSDKDSKQLYFNIVKPKTQKELAFDRLTSSINNSIFANEKTKSKLPEIWETLEKLNPSVNNGTLSIDEIFKMTEEFESDYDKIYLFETNGDFEHNCMAIHQILRQVFNK